MPSIQTRSLGLKAMLLVIIVVTLIVAWANLAEGDDANPGGAANGLESIWGTDHEVAPIDVSLYNGSIISLESQNNDTSTPVSIAVGNGYYSSHPVAYNSAISSETQVVNRGAAASMQHSVESAKGISGSSTYMVSESENRRGGSEYSSTTSQMMIDETVTEGKVHIGALQGGEASGRETGRGGMGSFTSAWKNPAIEIDEEYIGTYHISKNITFSNSERQLLRTDSWLNGFGNHFDIYLPEPVTFSADDVFSYIGK